MALIGHRIQKLNHRVQLEGRLGDQDYINVGALINLAKPLLVSFKLHMLTARMGLTGQCPYYIFWSLLIIRA